MSSSSTKTTHKTKTKDMESESKGELLKEGFDVKLMEAIKHYDTFYESAPPGLVKEDEERPEDCIPDLPENAAARDFLAKAPTKGLWMPLGKEVKVMKCWRCKTYGHRTGDKECPLFLSGNRESEEFRFIHEDPMYQYIQQNKTKDKQEKIKQLKALLDNSSSSSSSSSSSDSSDSDSSSTSSSSSDRHKKKSRKRRHRHKKDTKKHKRRRK